MDLKDLTHEDFAKRLNERFRIQSGSHSIEAELIEVRRLRPRGGRLREPFSLIFRGPNDVVFRQSILRVENENMGSLEIFLVPIGPDPGGMLYEAIFI